MTLPLPDLDDRRWADLVDEGRTLIPVHAPEWTDHNVHDPGITLMELFAWIAEMDVYRANRVPAARRRKLLALAGVAPRPPRGAVTAVGLELTAGAPVTLPAGLEVEGDDLFGVTTRFRTRRPLTAVAGGLEAVQTRSGDRLDDLTARWRRGEPLAVFGADPRPGAALYLGLRLPAGPPGETVSLYFSVAADDAEEADGAALHHSARLVWEARTGADRWQTLAADEARDATRSFTRGGSVELELPAAMVAGRLGAVDTELYYLRCRLVAGAFDAAPEVDAVLLNGVAAEQEVEVAEEDLGAGSGQPRQQLGLARPLVCGTPVELVTAEDGGPRAWTERPDFDASGRADAHFVVDRRSGTVVFGDGERGRTVPAGAPITATYGSTRGAAGNLGAGSVERLADTLSNRALLPDFDAVTARIAVRQPLPARGGSPGETLDEAASRAFELATTTERAVTLADYETQARKTPGVRLARVAARANLHPAFPCFRACGVVTVIVLPYLPVRRPVPSPGLRHAVAAWLGQRRPLGSRVEVVGPEWVEVMVRATVCACPGVSKRELAVRLGEALDRFFHPLRGGPDGDGWPFGRDVYRSEVLQVLDETAGSDHVLALELVDARGHASCGNLCLPPTALVAAGPHEIEVV